MLFDAEGTKSDLDMIWAPLSLYISDITGELELRTLRLSSSRKLGKSSSGRASLADSALSVRLSSEEDSASPSPPAE